MNGNGVRVDYARALRLYRQAAQLRYAPAMYAVGVMYFNGEGVAVDSTEGLAWYLLADRYGDSLARQGIGQAAAYMHQFDLQRAQSRAAQLERELARAQYSARLNDGFNRTGGFRPPSTGSYPQGTADGQSGW